MHLDEQKTAATHDYLEQCFDIFSILNKVVRFKPLIEVDVSGMMEDPDSFPIYDLTKTDFGKLSIWDKQDIKRKLSSELEFYLDVRKSSIDHPYAGDGVFMQCLNQIIPGSLIGFYPGVLINKIVLDTYSERHLEEKHYLTRPNNIVVDPAFEVPYPMKSYTCRILSRSSGVLYKNERAGTGKVLD